MPRGYLARLRDLTSKYEVLLILDEVATGFGRTGKMFACQHENVSPDIMTVAKSITGGYLPLAATLTTKKIFDAFLGDYKECKTFFHGHTYTGNPLGCAAAIACLDIFEKERTIENLKPKIEYLTSQLDTLKDMVNVGDIRQAGMMVGIELVRNRDTKDAFLWEEKAGARVSSRARHYGVILRPLGNVIVIMPPLSISIKEICHIIESVRSSIKDIF